MHVSEVTKEECDIKLIPVGKIQTQEKKPERILFERFRPSSSPIFPNAAAIKANSITDSMRVEKFNVKRYHNSPTSVFSGTPIISDSFADISHHSSIGSFAGNFLKFHF